MNNFGKGKWLSARQSVFWKYKVWPCLFLFVMSQALSSSLFAHEFEVDGTMRITPTGYPAFSHSIHIYVRDCQWAIFRVLEDSTYRTVVEISDDGDNIYKLTRVETKNGSFSPDDYANVIPNSLLAGEIHPSGFPFRMLEIESITLYYAYASSCYLDSLTNQIIGSIMLSPSELQSGDERSQALITRGSPPLRLPSKIIFWDDTRKWTNPIFSASEYTNFGNAQIPSRVSLFQYYQGETNILETFEFHATRILDTCSLKSFRPLLSNGALIADYRFSHQNTYTPGIPQIVTNTWPTMAESKLKRGYAATQINRENKGETEAIEMSIRRFWVRLLLALIFIAGIGGLVKMLFTKK